MFRLYFAKAQMMTMGSLPSVEFNYIPTTQKNMHCTIDTINECSDNDGDLCLRLNMKVFLDLGFPVLKFRLLHPSGVTGFEPLGTPALIHKIFFMDAYLLTDNPNPLHSLTDYVVNDEPFYARNGEMQMVVTFHQPNEKLQHFLSINRFSTTDTVTNVKNLIETVHMCKAVMVWSLAYGTNPVVLSTNSKAYISEIVNMLDAEQFELLEIDSEQKLPEW